MIISQAKNNNNINNNYIPKNSENVNKVLSVNKLTKLINSNNKQ